MRNAESGMRNFADADGGVLRGQRLSWCPAFVMGEGEGSKVRFYGKNQLLAFVRVEKQIKVTSIAFPE